MTEQQAIEQLGQYRALQARLRVLSSYDIGAGLTVSRLDGDDQLQDLHRRLRKLPSTLYLSAHEQRLETTAHAYLSRYPAGIRAQAEAVGECRGVDDEDRQLLRQLRAKVSKVMMARGYGERDDIDAVLDRLAEYQDLQAEIGWLDHMLSELESYKPEYARLLRALYVDGLEPEQAAAKLQVSSRTFRRRRADAEAEYGRLAR